jgi:hypothetical protein
MSFLAFGNIRVGDQVAETVRFDDKSNLCRGVLLDNSSDRIDVCLVLGETIIGDGQLSVGGQSSAITIGKIIDYERTDSLGTRTRGIQLLNVAEVCVRRRYFGSGITIIVSIMQPCTSMDG